MASVKSTIAGAVTRTLTSPDLQRLRRQRFALKRRLTGGSAQVYYFHQVDDPYSIVLASQLDKLRAAYRIELHGFVVPAPEASAAPDLARLAAWSVRDAARLAQRALGAFPLDVKFDFLPPATPEDLAHGAATRKRLGHYLGATLYFEGEWYWGLDRLHYLESRLHEAGLSVSDSPASQPLHIFPVPTLHMHAGSVHTSVKPVIHFFCSLRSPYTYLAAPRMRELARAYGAELKLRFVLPMVMRGLPVPWVKRLYILRDTKREAQRLGVPFGHVVDPVGRPVEAGLALLHHAIASGKGSALLESFLGAVFARGVDAGSEQGLLQIARAAGLSERDVQSALADPSWRQVAEDNRQEMLAGGIWGVPSFRVNDGPILWGRDRLWMLEEDLLAALSHGHTAASHLAGVS